MTTEALESTFGLGLDSPKSLDLARNYIAEFIKVNIKALKVHKINKTQSFQPHAETTIAGIFAVKSGWGNFKRPTIK